MADPEIAVRVGLDHDPDDPALTYTDIASRVYYGDGGQAVTVTIGRDNESDEIKPTIMSFALKNGDNLFTPNNPDSDYYEKWEQGRRVQVAETVDGEEFILGTGFLEIPAMAYVDPLSSQPVTVSAVDRMGRLEAAPDFESTLTEYIRNTDAGELVEYYPLSEASHPMMSLITGSTATIAAVQWGDDDHNAPDLIVPQSVDGPPGDDGRYPLWTVVRESSGLTRMYADMQLPCRVDADEVVAISAWVRKAAVEQIPLAFASSTLFSSAIGFISDVVMSDFASDVMKLTTDLGSETPASRRLETEAWRLVTLRLDLTQARADFWVGADLTLTQTGSPLSPEQLHIVTIGGAFDGSIAHVQVRVGDSTTFTHADHLAQHRAGYEGLHRQTVAERIRTLAGYAGVPASEVDVPDACSTPMQMARLAGVNPATAIRAAAATGQDIPVTTGAGLLSAVPRAQRYNQAVAMEIPWGWISRRSLRYRPDRPVTDVTVTRVGGGTVRKVDRALRSRYGVTGLRYDLDTAIDADAGNLASWAAAAHGRMRVRCPSLRINMLRRSAQERKDLLGLRIGDRIEITDPPAGQPEDMPHLIIQGIQHTIGPGRRRIIQFNTGPLLGPDIGVPPIGVMVGDLVSDTPIAY